MVKAFAPAWMEEPFLLEKSKEKGTLRVSAKDFRFLLRRDWVIAQPVAGPAMAKADCPVSFLRRGTGMGSGRVVAAVCFAVRFSPETGLFAVVLFAVCRCPIGFATAGFVPAADPFDPAGSGFAVAAAVDLFDLSGLSADLSVVAAGPGSVGSVVFAAGLASFVCPFAVALGRVRVVAVPFYFLTRRSSF